MSAHNLPSQPGRAMLAPGRAADRGKLVHLSRRGARELGQDGSVRIELTRYAPRRLRVRRAGERLQR